MQNSKPPSLSLASTDGSPTVNALDRVIAIAPTPLLRGEEKADYAEVAMRLVNAAKPRDAIEEFLIRDALDLTWEILRLRRAKTGILKASMNTGVEGVLEAVSCDPRRVYRPAQELSSRWMAGDKSARKEVEAALNRAQLSIDDVTAKTLEHKLVTFERLDRMLASVEARRNNALRVIDRHRSAFGAGVRQAIDEAENARVPRHRDGRSDCGVTALTSDRQRRANQANAKASSGPKTRAGKERAAQNALRHGLSIPVSSDPALSPQAEAIASRIAGPDAKAEALEQARRIGEAQVDLNRVRARRMALVGDPNYQPLSVLKHSGRRVRLIRMKGLALPASDAEVFESVTTCKPLKNCKPLEGLEKLGVILQDRASELARVDRYERGLFLDESQPFADSTPRAH